MTNDPAIIWFKSGHSGLEQEECDDLEEAIQILYWNEDCDYPRYAYAVETRTRGVIPMDEVDGLIRVHARRTRARRAAELELLRAAQAAAPPKLYQVEVQAPTMAEGDGYGGKWHTEGLFETSAELVEACNKLNQIFPAERIRITWNGETDD